MGKKNKCPPFVMLRTDLLKDPKWKSLPSSVKIIYIYMRAKFNYKTLSTVSLTYRELDDMFNSATISKAFKELEKAQFIQKTKQGGLFGGVCTYKFVGQYKDFYYRDGKFKV